MKNYIGIFDSGIGGLTTLKEIRNILPNENFIYYADSKHNPYGEKSDKELFSIVTNIVEYLIKKDVKMIVIACNTATTRCIKMLRRKYKDMLFVGVEPAIKVACDNNYKNTILLATPATIKSNRTHELITNFKHKNQNIISISCYGLANAIETNNESRINTILHSLLDQYKDKNIDSIVLGCTHYPYIKNNISSIIQNATIIDGNIGVSKQVKRLLIKNNLLNTSNTKGKLRIIIKRKLPNKKR